VVGGLRVGELRVDEFGIPGGTASPWGRRPCGDREPMTGGLGYDAKEDGMRSRNILPLKKAFGSCRTVVTSVANQSGGHVHLGLTGPAVLWFSVVRTEETAETYAALVAVRMGAAPTNMLFDGIVAVSLRAGYPDMSGPFSTRLSVNGKGPDL